MADITPTVESVLSDPSSMGIAKVYAQGLLATAVGEEQAIVEELNSFVDDVLKNFPQFDRLLRGGLQRREVLEQLIDRVVGSRGSHRFVQFLKVLARHRRLDLLPTIREATVLEWDTRNKIRRVEVIVARPISDEQAAQLRDTLARKLGQQPQLHVKVDPSMLGGLVIRVGDTQFDGSIRTKLKQLRASMRERCLNEIQRGRDRFGNPSGN